MRLPSIRMLHRILIPAVALTVFGTITIASLRPARAQSPAAAAPGGVERQGDDTAPALPVRLQIPSLHIDAPIVQVGFDDDGGMASPNSDRSVGWFAPGYIPGTPGNAVMAGHVDWVDHAAVFWFLNKLAVGDTMTVVFDDDSSVTFAVDAVQTYDDGDTPLDQVFGASDSAHLNLVTCGGVFDYATHNYDHRTVVYTTMVSADPAPPAPSD